jgi:hypothetical protein
MPIRKKSERHGRTEETAECSSAPRPPGDVDTKGIGTNLVHMKNEVFEPRLQGAMGSSAPVAAPGLVGTVHERAHALLQWRLSR